MPTNKPRITFTIEQNTLDKIDDFRYSNKIKNQSQAILTLLEKGLSDIELSEDILPLYSNDAMAIARAYDDLDSHGREMLRTVSEKELVRKAKEDAAREEANRQKNKAEQMSASKRSMRYYIIPSAAGYASPIEGEDYEIIEVGDEVPQNASFCIDIDGDSMEPYIHDGQRVYIQRDVDVKEFEDAGIWFYNGNVYCKQYCVDVSGTLMLLSANPKRQDANIRISPEEQSSLFCCGKVLLPFKLPRPQY